MSRIGKLPIDIADKAEVSIENNIVTVKGPKGELTETIDSDIEVKIEEGRIILSRPTDQKRHRSLHGLYRALIANMIEGVVNGYTIKQELVGVGFRANVSGQLLELTIGYSHPVAFELPKEIKVSAETVKGKNPTITLESADKQLIGQVAAKIRSLRPPEPYKGKGIKYVGEELRRKAGKTAAK